METTKITEGNKLIAEFMGYQINIGYNKQGVLFAGQHINANKLLYHSSWDWLMPVVEKIESLNFTTSIYHLPKTLNTVKIFSGGADVVGKNGETKMEAVYKAVIEFIKWYNQK